MNRRTAIKQAALITGYAISATAVSAVWQSCQRDPATAAEAWKPVFFTAEEAAAITEIGESILPATDTPGAKDVDVHAFIDQFVKDCLKEEEQTQFRTGLKQLLSDCEQQNGKSFVDCTTEQRLAFLNEQDEAARQLVELNPGLPDEQYPFFLKLKEMVLMGYFTSEKVGKEVTAFLPVPGKFEPCTPYETGQPAWTIYN
jgi:hypothetical protein